MSRFRPVVSLYLDQRYQRKDGTYYLKLRVSFTVDGKQVQKYYPTGYTLSEKDWERFNSKSRPFLLNQMREEVGKFEAEANEIVKNNPSIKPEYFDALLKGFNKPGSGIKALYGAVISDFEDEGRISTASAYRCSMNSLVEYGGDFPLEIVDFDFLTGYERKMIEKGETITTVGFYLRCLRAIYNRAIEKRSISKDLYPFGRKGYTIPRGSNYKKALKKTDKIKLENVKLKDDKERKAVAIWLFSYFGNGMNLQDMAYLRPSNIHGDVISFVRRKTMRTVREVKPIVVPLRAEMKRILKEYGQHEPFCFGVIAEDQTPAEKYRKIQDWIKLTNKYVNQVTKRLKINGKVNSYAARHSFASALLNNNVNVKAIQQSLGHRSLATTEAYLADLNIEEAKKISKLL